MITAKEIKSLSEEARKEERAFIEAETMKKGVQENLEGLIKTLEATEAPDTVKKAFSEFIDRVILQGGQDGLKNPLEAYIDELDAKADDIYNIAKERFDNRKGE